MTPLHSPCRRNTAFFWFFLKIAHKERGNIGEIFLYFIQLLIISLYRIDQRRGTSYNDC